MNAWEILNLEPTTNKRLVKKAYAKALTIYHPEDHPKEFEAIQKAYQEIMDSLNNQDIIKDDIEIDESPSKLLNKEDHKTESLYDNLNPQSEQSGYKHIQIIDNSNTDKVDPLDFFIRKVKEKLSFRYDINTVNMLFNNKLFNEAIKDKEYYLKLVDIFMSYIELFDEDTLNYVNRIFKDIETRYHYENERSITNSISIYKANIKKKERNRKILTYLLLFITLLIIVFIGL